MSNDRVHYYLLIKDLDKDLKPYKRMPMYDDNPGMESYCSTLGVYRPREGDYLICWNDDFDFSSPFRDFEDVKYTYKPNVNELLEKNIIKEVSREEYDLRFKTIERLMELDEEIFNCENAIDFMKHSEEGYSKEEMLHEETKLEKLNKELNELQSA